MATIFNVAKYITQRLGSITTMKLQKLVYYCQAWSLAWDEEPLFDEDFQAWANGPVCSELFDFHRGKFKVDASTFSDITDYAFNQHQIETMDAVLMYYGDKDPQWLSALTHKEDPWKNVRCDIPEGVACSRIITKESMQQYYGGLQ